MAGSSPPSRLSAKRATPDAAIQQSAQQASDNSSSSQQLYASISVRTSSGSSCEHTYLSRSSRFEQACLGRFCDAACFLFAFALFVAFEPSHQPAAFARFVFLSRSFVICFRLRFVGRAYTVFICFASVCDRTGGCARSVFLLLLFVGNVEQSGRADVVVRAREQ